MAEIEPNGQAIGYRLSIEQMHQQLEEEYIRLTREIEGLSRSLNSYFDRSRPASARPGVVVPRTAEGTVHQTSARSELMAPGPAWGSQDRTSSQRELPYGGDTTPAFVNIGITPAAEAPAEYGPTGDVRFRHVSVTPKFTRPAVYEPAASRHNEPAGTPAAPRPVTPAGGTPAVPRLVLPAGGTPAVPRLAAGEAPVVSRHNKPAGDVPAAPEFVLPAGDEPAAPWLVLPVNDIPAEEAIPAGDITTWHNAYSLPEPVSTGITCAPDRMVIPVAQINKETTKETTSQDGGQTSQQRAVCMKERPVIKPDRYDGKGQWASYITHFEMCARINGWDNDAKLQYLAVLLTRTAQQVLGSLPKEASGDFDKLVKALEARFDPTGRKELHRAQLRNRRQKTSESLVEMAEEIRKLGEKVYVDLPTDSRDRMGKDHFMDALNDSEIRTRVIQMRTFTLDEAVAAAVELEALQRVEKERRLADHKMVRNVQLTSTAVDLPTKTEQGASGEQLKENCY